MASVDSYYKGLGGKHEDNCEVCRDTGHMASDRSQGVLSRLWQSAWFVWFLVAIVVVAAYALAIRLAYVIVGGM